jgi:hypothetical protein
MTKTGILQPAKPEALIFDIANSHVSRRWGPAAASISTMLRSGRSTLRWKTPLRPIIELALLPNHPPERTIS